MAKFKKKTSASASINTGSLPDIIFMLLFFFMVTTRMRDTSIMVEQQLPKASQLQEIEQKSLVSYIYIGRPKEPAKFGTEPRIQVNDVFISTSDIPQFVVQEKDKLNPSDRNKIWMSLKVDTEAKMGIINDVQLRLREAEAYKLNYSSVQTAGVAVQ